MQENMWNGFCISSITLAELNHGVFTSITVENNNIALIQFLSIIKNLPFDGETAFEYGKIVGFFNCGSCTCDWKDINN